ncbi:uncharacterized protein A4U43_C02F15140 [Asparagus officinalis]|uniref:Uncharacterized protein n=1 Tax=Asparagus officinalis TaxID=4686 RepID=A0A5P1FNF9_ASPOF|nr:uncharacterized protein A4U43_C02F15140 [Asparagus officinalis]
MDKHSASPIAQGFGRIPKSRNPPPKPSLLPLAVDPLLPLAVDLLLRLQLLLLRDLTVDYRHLPSALLLRDLAVDYRHLPSALLLRDLAVDYRHPSSALLLCDLSVDLLLRLQPSSSASQLLLCVEICRSISKNGGIDAIFQFIDGRGEYNNKAVARACYSLLSKVMSIIGILSLRSLENAARAVEAGDGDLAIQSMQKLPSAYQMQR